MGILNLLAVMVVPFAGQAQDLAAMDAKVRQFAWLYADGGMYILLLVALGEVAWVFIDSQQKRKADKALMPRILGLVGVFFVLPAFIFRFTGNIDGITTQIRLTDNTMYTGAIPWNFNWLVAGYGQMIAMLALFGVALGTLAVIIYASTVSRSRPSTEFVSALNNQFGEIRQEIQQVKARPAAPTAAPTAVPGVGTAAPAPARSAATVIERPSGAAATIIDRPGGMAELRAVAGPTTGRTWKLPQGEAKIGRDAGNLIAIEDSKASREHAKVRWADGTFTITDLGSSNGTFVNERPISGQTPLGDGDLIRIGDTTLAFKPTGA